jgi:hypothetical protein
MADDDVWLAWNKADELDEERVRVRFRKRLVDDILGEVIQHSCRVDILLRIRVTYVKGQRLRREKG